MKYCSKRVKLITGLYKIYIYHDILKCHGYLANFEIIHLKIESNGCMVVLSTLHSNLDKGKQA